MEVTLLYPMFLMVVLICIVATIAVKARVSSVKNKQVSAKYFQLMEGSDIPDIITKTTRNFNNQFEIPVLFYVVATLYISFDLESFFAIAVAWSFVIFRFAHSYIHLTYNNIIHRMLTFWLSFLCVLILWINLLIQKV